ncbi:MAG TPA: hypothetical protein VHK88_09390 [Aquihabitans sp.]|jgi:GMP synthase (glutamine-hydrolysing)|nr:hypothetical protein [Aquihabitans sp.]
MSDRLRIGLLQCGYVHPDLAGDFGDYPVAFGELLEPHDVELVTYDVQTGPLPDDPGAVDGWLVSGSASSAYERLPWIPPLEAFLRGLVARDAPVVAICFGHQLVAQAHGGRVERSPAGWGAGAHDYELVGTGPWGSTPDRRSVRLIASHQDQVVDLPDGDVVIARTDHCPIAGYTLGTSVLAIQAHPEFTAGLSARLTQARRDRIGDATADAALASLDAPLDRAVVGSWMADHWRR